MHEEDVNIARVVDEEGFMARGDQVTSFLVGAETDLLLNGLAQMYPFKNLSDPASITSIF